LVGELGIPFGGFRESKAIQLRVDFDRLHGIIISFSRGSAVRGPAQSCTLRHGQMTEAGGHFWDTIRSYICIGLLLASRWTPGFCF
jgi:hypothetical protein